MLSVSLTLESITITVHYEDVGAFQLYGTGVENLAVGLTMARGGGIAAWGQWRTHYGNPNLRNQFIGCSVLEGLRAEHQETVLGSQGFGDPLQFDGHVFAIAGAACGTGKDAGMPCDGTYWGQAWHTGGSDATLREMNRLIVFRRNHARSNGGFWLGPAIDVLVEGNSVRDTPNGSVAGTGAYAVSDASRGVLLRGNFPPPMKSDDSQTGAGARAGVSCCTSQCGPYCCDPCEQPTSPLPKIATFSACAVAVVGGAYCWHRTTSRKRKLGDEGDAAAFLSGP